LGGGRLALAAAAGLLLAAALLFFASSPPPPPAAPPLAPTPQTEHRPLLVLGHGTGRIVSAAQDYLLFVAYLEARLPVRCRIRIVPDGAEYQRRIASGEIDLAYLAPFEFVEARERAGAVPIVMPTTLAGSQTYRGIVMTNRPEIQTLSDLRSRRVTFVDDQSASGYLFPLALLYEKGIDPVRDFASFEPSGSHENVVLNVLSGRFDAGFTLEDGNISEESARLRKNVRTIATTASIPPGMLAFSRVFVRDHPALADSVRKVLEGMSRDEAGRAAFSKIFRGATGIKRPRVSDFDGVVRVRDTLRRRGVAL